MHKRKAEMSILGALIAFALIMLLCPVFEFYNISRKSSFLEENIKNISFSGKLSGAKLTSVIYNPGSVIDIIKAIYLSALLKETK